MVGRRGLGKGLGALIEDADTLITDQSIIELKISDVEPNNKQPRKRFDDDKLEELATSIEKHGIMQPIIVKKEGIKYLIVAGERRWRAARLAGLKAIPCIIKDLTSREVMEMALIENLQREDLNPLEEAEAYENLMKEYGLTQEQLSESVGKSRSAIANTLRLLKLDPQVRGMVADGSLSSGHARALLGLNDASKQFELSQYVYEHDLNVRQVEEYVKKLNNATSTKKKNKKNISPEIKDVERKLKSYFGTRVKIDPFDNKKGKLSIEYYSLEDFDRILDLIMKSE